MISFSEMKKGMMVEIDGQIFQIVEYNPFRMAQRAAMAKVKFKNIKTGRTFERTMQPGEKMLRVQLEPQTAQYQYSDGDLYYFMDIRTFEQITLSKQVLGDAVYYLQDGINVQIMNYKGQPVTVELPITVELKVADTGPAFKGDTAAGGSKPAKLETGLEVKVPLFVDVGDRLKIDTRTGEYLERIG
ncbi:MAG: elongation factor P [Chloroflexi bacterium]|nr:elongation factor P [Chloroflexota bacterium]